MIVHVAAAGEGRGRVVLQLGNGEPSTLALEAAVRVAQAFGSEIESLFVESQQLFQLASYPFAREISLTGRSVRSITSADIEQDMRAVSQAVQRKLDALARAAEVPLRIRTMRADPLEALGRACAEVGPWNVVALGQPVGAESANALAAILDAVADVTGIVLVGPKCRRTRGPVVLAIEDEQHLPAMLSAAERLAPVCALDEAAGETVILLVGSDAEELAGLDSHVRLLLGNRADVRIATSAACHGAPSVVAETLRRLAGGFVIAAFGGIVVPGEGDLRPLGTGLECPLFLVR
jgi:hypothetical protein